MHSHKHDNVVGMHYLVKLAVAGTVTMSRVISEHYEPMARTICCAATMRGFLISITDLTLVEKEGRRDGWGREKCRN